MFKIEDRSSGTSWRTPILARLLVCAFAATVLTACASDEEEYQERPVEVIYNKAMDRLLDGDAELAAIDFDEVERQHPYSVWARKSQLMAAYSQYLVNNYDDAIFTAQRFLQLHPGNRDAPYAYYLIAISYYEQIADIGREQKITELALDALREVVDRYPSSEYARDARLKIDLARDHLAGKEMEIGRYYLDRDHFGAAINRFRHVVTNYQTTSHVPEALHRLTEAYLSLGILEEAKNTAAVLGHNYPGSEWYLDSYALLTGDDQRIDSTADEPWYSQMWTSVF
ncbi:MAG: outer membrane protein assembly factor BamD [Rhodospirillaceae bacterium]|jgi:outer membrane protein assembly factor BamD|nr:outer membrane protein assembly factor BamD [Rhodospirillaceae bacterium]MBT4491369.1 outer membrane protein assembly factor BamD [Rhodospirillaceae bacterium]MBT5191441.1 outer membrane protein assembly factor BamD [Rhodospirillaceae bacterium]MBT6426164.1 outer membrane protein assembly factor BamD [Rhodospirillaceae bacterium]MBT7760682.1 outer membrane protein assembly factor BamD [Rhodospirillaceae bacterium]